MRGPPFVPHQGLVALREYAEAASKHMERLSPDELLTLRSAIVLVDRLEMFESQNMAMDGALMSPLDAAAVHDVARLFPSRRAELTHLAAEIERIFAPRRTV